MHNPEISAIASQIQLAVAPVFLLAGVGAILNVLANRLARVVDRARRVSAAAESLDPIEREHALVELRLLSRRACCCGAPTPLAHQPTCLIAVIGRQKLVLYLVYQQTMEASNMAAFRRYSRSAAAKVVVFTGSRLMATSDHWPADDAVPATTGGRKFGRL